jgi:hypothetical protein
MILGVLACVCLAGCTTGGTGVGATPNTSGDQSSTTTTTGCPPYGTFSPKPIPEKPTTLSNTSVAEYAAAAEEAIVWNRNVEDEKISVGVHASNATVVETTRSGYIVHVIGQFSFEDCRDGGYVAGEGLIEATYFVNNTTVVRLADPPSPTADPRGNGTVVKSWNATTRLGA